ncbi:Gfo/Idh/MocA family protein [Kitasatospora sp. NPDC057198]|uniref:Gfo/Idh/MocA family protein n=1 Tax=Kitasatospora sp. NPDC057198 TaxID=3346046 RepID=UPI00363DCCC2
MPDLDVGLIGSGTAARTRLAAWLALGARVRVYSPDGRHHRLAAEHAPYHVTAAVSLRRLLSHSALVDVCTPAHSRHAFVLAAARTGCDTVCELPSAADPTEARQAADAAEAAGVHLFPAGFERWGATHASLRRALADGTAEFGPTAVLEFGRTAARPDRSHRSAAGAGGDGRVLAELSVHDFDLARSLAGEVVRVFAQLQAEVQGPPVAATVVLTHASGTVSLVRGRWVLPGTTVGTTARLSGPRGEVWQHASAPVGPADARRPSPWADDDPTVAGLRAFTTAVRTGRPAPVTARDGVMAARIVAAARLSAFSGRAVELSAED